MPEYTDRIEVSADPEAVYQFVSDVNNLPKYLPTVHHATPQSGERVEVEGKANGHAYNSDGWFKTDAGTKTMTWGSDGENDYSGRMTVTGSGKTAVVECALKYSPKPDVEKSMDDHQGGASAAMTDGLRASLQSIKQICEGTGGKAHSTAE